VVYLVNGDVARFQSLVLALPDEGFRRVPELDGEPVTARWTPPPVERVDLSLPMPDIWTLASSPASFAMTREVAERLEPFISMAGELLPLRPEPHAGRLYALNVCVVGDVHAVLDTRADYEERLRTVKEDLRGIAGDETRGVLDLIEQGAAWPVLYPRFREKSLVAASTFFRVKGLAAYFLHDLTSNDDTLLRRVELHGVTGLALRKVWSSAAGAEHINLFRP
jgi:hypothetical protein